MVPNVMLCPPNTLAAIVTPVAFATTGWATVARRSSFATDQRRLEDGKGEECSYPSRIVFFVTSFKPASKLGRSFATVLYSKPNVFQ